MRSGERTPWSSLEELIGYDRDLKRLWRIFIYHQGVFARLTRKDHPFIGKQGRHEFIDVCLPDPGF